MPARFLEWVWCTPCGCYHKLIRLQHSELIAVSEQPSRLTPDRVHFKSLSKRLPGDASQYLGLAFPGTGVFSKLLEAHKATVYAYISYPSLWVDAYRKPGWMGPVTKWKNGVRKWRSINGKSIISSPLPSFTVVHQNFNILFIQLVDMGSNMQIFYWVGPSSPVLYSATLTSPAFSQPYIEISGIEPGATCTRIKCSLSYSSPPQVGNIMKNYLKIASFTISIFWRCIYCKLIYFKTHAQFKIWE